MTKPEAVKKLQKLITFYTSKSFPLHSRVHKMQKADLYVKRDDELNFSISGSKLRKYASILPQLKKQKQKIALIGSPYSNHILSFVQLLKQEGLPYHLFLEKPQKLLPQGNFFFLSLLLSPEEITWVDKVPDIVTKAQTEKWEEDLQENLFWVPVGGCMKEGFFGALTLPLDLLVNEQEINQDFTHIFVDAGTGITAVALILGLAYIQKKCLITVVLLAGTEKSFVKELHFFTSILEEALQEKLPFPNNYQLVFPITGKSFGSCNAKVFKTITEVAREEGFFLDPIYTAKLYLTAKELSKKTALWIHSGGALSITGFCEPLLKRSHLRGLFLDSLLK